jgi:hypothetical protein
MSLPNDPAPNEGAPRLLTPRRLLTALVIAGLFATILKPVLLEKLGVGFSAQWFLDSYAILAANDAVRAGIDVQTSNPLDALNRPHVYSDWWLGLRWLGLTREHNFLLGGLWSLAFLVVALASVKPRTTGDALLLAAVLLSPPYLIAVQRGNNDLLIFALLGTCLLGLQRGLSLPRLIVFGACVVVATGLKYYPLVAAGALLVALPWRASVLWTFAGTTVLALLALASERHSIGRGMFELPQTIYQFGAPVLWRGFDASRGVTALLAIALLGTGAAIAVRRKITAGLADETHGTPGERLMFATGAILLLGCFLAGTSYIYRWIFGLWMWPWLSRQTRATNSGAGANAALGLWLLSLWTDGLCCLVVNSLGLSFRPGPVWRIWTQLINWSLMALLVGWLLEALSVQFTAWRRSQRTSP